MEQTLELSTTSLQSTDILNNDPSIDHHIEVDSHHHHLIVNNDIENDNESDATISQLNVNDYLAKRNRDTDYDEVISYVQREEKKCTTDLKRNQQLIPETVRKGRCDIKINKPAYDFFVKENNPSNFYNYIKQRRDSAQSLEATLIHCSQFITYAKIKNTALKAITGVIELLNELCRNHPTLCHQHFDCLYESNLQASTILARIDSLTLLYEWIRLNTDNMNIYNDVSQSINLLFFQLISFDCS